MSFRTTGGHAAVRYKLWVTQRHRCGICKQKIRRWELSNGSINIDHIRPQSHGGGNRVTNLQVTHLTCNNLKADNCAGCPHCKPEEYTE